MMHAHDDFELKRALDALPRAIEPPGEDLWPAIRAGLRAGRPAATGSDADAAAGTRDAVAPPVGAAPAGVGAVRALPARRLLPARPLRVAALLTLLAVSAGALLISRHDAGTWRVASGSNSARRFVVGEELATGTGTARFTVGRIGEVDAGAGTRVRLLEAKWSEHRLALERGTLHARINAPPRLFIVETPTGTAVDLGCAYTLEVDSAGTSSIHVTAGWVEFTERGRTSLIPAGFQARTWRGAGVGTPVADDAPAELLAAVQALDSYGAHGMAADSALDIILRTARPRDAVTLWHVLTGWRGSVEQRERVYHQLAAFVPPPDEDHGGRFAAVYGDPMTMRIWWQKLPGTLPIVPEWQRTLWMLYLRVTG